jgi:uncharacterized membrane protein (GlpM family)
MWEFDFSQLKHIELKDYVVRFLFGGAISVLAALVSQLTNGRIGGIFTAFPAILLASLTIISREDGKHETEEDARGGIVGAIAFVITAIVLSLTLKLLAGALALLLALVVWLLCAVGLYVLSYKSQWLRVSKQNPRAPDTR